MGDVLTADVLAAFGLVLSVLLAYMQIQKNQRASIELQETHLRNELKLKLYEKVSAVMYEAGHKLSRVNAEYTSALRMLSLRVRQGVRVSPRQTGQHMIELAADAHQQLSRVLSVLEEYEIAFLRFGAFRRQLAESHRELVAANDQLYTKISWFLALDDSDTIVLGERFPKEEELTEMEAAGKSYSELCMDVAGYLIDLQIETQNELLGGLFKRTLPARQPLDENVKVLQRDGEALIARPKGKLI